MSALRWGVVTTIKAPAEEILDFAAYHIDLGAHRLFLYLDAPITPKTFHLLKSHPKIRLRQCDESYWKKMNGWRPQKHQVRQSFNATHAYSRAKDVDWLAHIDVDEFIASCRPLPSLLSALPENTFCARMRPAEALAGSSHLFKTFLPASPQNNATIDQIYPRFGRYLKSGFLSHVAGKLFARTGRADIEFRIHNLFDTGTIMACDTELSDVTLCHVHVKNWTHWQEHFAYRLQKGSYRADLAAARARETSETNLHSVLQNLQDTEGNAGLRTFFTEVCEANETVCKRLSEHGLLQRHDLDLLSKRQRHFPDYDTILN